MKKNVIISLADSKYFDLLNELIDSIKRFKESEKVAFCVLDAGLNKDQVKILTSKVDEIKNEIIDRFGKVPEITENLFSTAKIRSILQTKQIIRCKTREFQIELFPIDLTEDLKLSIEKYDKTFIFRNKRLVINFNQSLTPESTYELLDSIL